MRMKIKDIKKIVTRKGAPKPAPTSPFWNEWAANNPQPEAKALKALDPSDALMLGIKGITTGARPVNHVY
jgi:hypothetical protein